MQLKTMTISPIMNPCPEIWDNHALSLENKNMLIKSIQEILKTKHNGKPNAGCVTISTCQPRQMEKALTEKRAPHLEKKSI
jgi:hypothetical protein